MLFPACNFSPTDVWVFSLSGHTRVEPPEEYRTWWETTEACSSIVGDFDLVEWYRALEIVTRGTVLLGRWEPPHQITIVQAHELNTFVVRHEILHELLRGDSNHQGEAWLQCELIRPRLIREAEDSRS